jgi:hypothetical protein
MENPALKRDIELIKQQHPQRELFWKHYFNPDDTETFGNATQAALASGWDEKQAPSVSQQTWFKIGTRRAEMKDVAEGVLSEMLKLPKTRTQIIKGEEVVIEDPALIKIKQDTAKYITSTLMKKHYSTRNENTGPNGGPVRQEVVLQEGEFERIIQQYASKKGIQTESGTPEKK